MAQFIPFEQQVQVNGQTILSVTNGVNKFFKAKMDEILIKYGIINPKADEWYSQESWLNAFKDISDTIGKHTLFSIGKAIPENADFPKEINNLETALNSINIAYHNNHKGGEIGYYKLISFSQAKKKCCNGVQKSISLSF